MAMKLAAGMAGSAMKKSVSSAVGSFSSQRDSGIEWSDYQWPFANLGIVHFDISELPPGKRGPVRLGYTYFWFCLGMFLANVIFNIIYTAIGVPHAWQWICYSAFNLIIVVIYAFYTLYKGYKAVAMGDRPVLYLILQIIFLLFECCYIVIPAIFFHGIIGLSVAPLNTGAGPILVIIESVMWVFLLIFGIISIIAMMRAAHSSDSRV
ncbi:hypothetical protein PAPYR_207 [Paratrimastix pyriformis]|uniref:Secretory carrier membrane protein n=1 Tax=Paratrimastix pyriformis TaxID=342808 RepID=A0ABQ8UYY1_9EUKA|nr:hypothetical protein PAPYR_207 [Paratrimastix pyriformis]|eukprot:GAFH01005112.1.p1 GENE.GAFH01005112.1~~GAFH01005112.1.p1  ORF type:complete len:208 (-),score=23.73 GAFH01005112.1:66-689(-)